MPGGQIKGLPNGWIWMYKGEEEWTTRTGKPSNERHAYNTFTGERLSVRDVRTFVREGQGLPSREVPTKTFREGVLYTRKSVHRYRGNTVTYSFGTLEEAQAFVVNGGIPSDYQQFIIQAKFWKSSIPGKNYRRYKNGRLVPDKYTSLSNFLTRNRGTRSSVWDQVYDKANEFQFNKNSRFYVYATEQ